MDITAICMCFFLLLVCFTCQGCMEDERDALLKIKRSINFPEGTAFSNWYGKECCNWEGVECDVNTARVSMIFIMHKRGPSFSESWYPDASLFAQFKDLKKLILPGNKIGGFTSTHELNKLKHLQTLDLRDNDIAKGSHLCWGKLPSLNFLYLSNNKLQGNLSNCVCDNPSISELSLSDNKLEGNIPACLGNMTSLEYLSLSRNEFRGKLPLSIFANLSRLSYLDMSYNSDLEIEPDSPSWFPSFSLSVLKLASCNLKSIPRFLSRQPLIESLDLSHNLLSGNIPSWLLFNFTSKLMMRGNNFSGLFLKTFPNISSRVTVLDISNNSLQGPLPKEIGQIFLQLRHLDISSNNFNGSLPNSFTKMIQLEYLDLSDNEFLGEIPHGVTSNATSLLYLRLSRNKFSGVAIPTNASLPNLRWLYLDRNDFSGTFPDSLCRSMDLQIVDMQNNGLSGELSSYLPALPQLKLLILGGNRFVGSIPPQLCHMINLHLLDLSRNNLSGGIPTCVDNITSLTEATYHPPLESAFSYDFTTKGMEILYRGIVASIMSGIDVSCNRLTGEIPILLTHLVNMHSLNMSHNLLTGPIHKSFANVTELESLDLSHNNLFGELSIELTHMTGLMVFKVSFNNLSGEIPLLNQFDTFDNDSYLGNPLLCGHPLSKGCHERAETSGYFTSNMATVNTLLFWCVFFLLSSD